MGSEANRYLLALLPLLLVGCDAKPNKPPPTVSTPEAHPLTTMDLLAQGSPDVCAAEDVKRTLLALVAPDTASAKALANSGIYSFRSGDVDSFASAIDATVGMVTVAGINKQIKSVKCEGQIILSAPAYRLSAPEPIDVAYEVRPSIEDPSNFIISANTGIAKAQAQNLLEQIVQQVQSKAADVAAQNQAAADARAEKQAALAAQAASQPSFSCAHVTSYVLNTICANPDLISLDNQLSSAYRAAIAKAAIKGDIAGRETLVAEERAWLASRQQCSDVACITQAYNSRLEALRNGPFS